MDIGTLYNIYKDNTTNIRVLCGILLITFILGGYVQTILINTLIFGYLSYKSMETLGTASTTRADEYVQLSNHILKQWIIFSTCIVLEYFLGFLVGIIYTSLKLVGFVFLLQNNSNLLIVYDYGLLPL